MAGDRSRTNSRHRRRPHSQGRRDHSNELPPPSTYDDHRRDRHSRDRRALRDDGIANNNKTSWVRPAGESGRSGFHPIHFAHISFKSASRASLICNFLWPVVPVAIVVRYALPDHHVLIFTLAYIAMVPCANMIGFAGQEFARKLPHVWGVLVEITCGSVVEIVLFMVLLSKDEFYVIKAAIMGSILATMLLCLGACFFAGGLLTEEQTFSDAISEAGSGLLLTAGVVLSVPTIFEQGIEASDLSTDDIDHKVLQISRVISILLLIAYAVYAFFQARTHHGIYDAVFEHDERRDRDREKVEAKPKLTLTEAIIALSVSVGLVTHNAIILVFQIEPIIERGDVTDAFMGLILVPLVEKFAEHLTAIDEAWDNQMNFALSHVLGATLQTALFTGPLAVIVGWGLQKDMNLSFEVFHLVMLVLAILTVGRFLQDQKSNYLEGFLLLTLYFAIGVAAWYYPDPVHAETSGTTEH